MFKVRSEQKELLDEDEIPTKDLYQNLRELDFINHWLGGYQISFHALRTILRKGRPFQIADIGCGGGDTLKRIAEWNRRAGFELDLAGIDIKPVCIEYAAKNLKNTSVQLICDDYRHIFRHLKKVDIIHACLFCHHLTREELIGLIRFALENRVILLINDLERNAIAYYSIKWLTQIFSKSYLVRNDAPLSVLRGFRRKEWIEMLQAAGAERFSVTNKWAFRHEVIVYGNGAEKF